MRLYAVIVEGYMDYYGSKKYCIGIYDTKELAEKAENEYFKLVQKEANNHPLEECTNDDDDYYDDDDEYGRLRYCANNKETIIKIMEFDLNKTYNMMLSGRFIIEFINDKCLGRYVE